MNKQRIILIVVVVIIVVVIGVLIGVFGSSLVNRLMEFHRGG